MLIPKETTNVTLRTYAIPATIKDALAYCMGEAVEHDTIGSLSYDHVQDHLTYHIHVADFDRDLFPWLRETVEIWIITKAGATES